MTPAGKHIRAPIGGKAHGTLLGGNLTTLAATTETRHKLVLTSSMMLIDAVIEDSRLNDHWYG